MTVARLAGRVTGGSTGPGAPSLVAGMVCCWSRGLRQSADVVPGGDEVGGPGPACLDVEAALAAAASQPGGGVQDAVAQGLRFGLGEGAVEGEQLEPGEQGRGGQGGGLPGLVYRQRGGGEFADPAVVAGADGIFDLGMPPVSGVDVGGLAQPALGGRGPVGNPQAVSPAVFGLEQGQLGTGVRALAAGEDPHRGGPGGQMVPGWPFAQQAGQLGDVRLFDPAPEVPAVQVPAGALGAPLAGLAALIDRDLPGAGRDGADRGLLPLAQLPADRVDDLVAAPGGEGIQPGDQAVAGPAPSQVTISRRLNAGGSAVIAASSTVR
jgi:hypothetical protein